MQLAGFELIGLPPASPLQTLRCERCRLVITYGRKGVMYIEIVKCEYHR